MSTGTRDHLETTAEPSCAQNLDGGVHHTQKLFGFKSCGAPKMSLFGPQTVPYKELLYDLGECLVDGVVVDRCQLEGKGDRCFEFS